MGSVVTLNCSNKNSWALRTSGLVGTLSLGTAQGVSAWVPGQRAQVGDQLAGGLSGRWRGAARRGGKPSTLVSQGCCSHKRGGLEQRNLFLTSCRTLIHIGVLAVLCSLGTCRGQSLPALPDAGVCFPSSARLG